MLTITKRLEFDAGHRIAEHASQCRNVHGHRYVLEITLSGTPVNAPGTSSHGMLMDFAAVTELARTHLLNHWDHACLVHSGDALLLQALALIPDHKTVVLATVPTVENLAQLAFATLAPLYAAEFGQRAALSRVRLYETPTCWADAEA